MFYNCDCIDGARKYLGDNSVDLIITDPPYGIAGDQLHKHYNRNETKVLDGYIDVPHGEYPEFTREWIKEAERVLKPGGSLYIVSGYTQLRHILNALADTGLEEVNHIIWKYNFGVHTSLKYISSHYHILYYVKPGARPTFNTYAFYSDTEKNDIGGSANYKDREDVWVIHREYKHGGNKNKNQLPKALLTKMILYSSNPDDLVCDFFLGSFSTAKIAIGLGRNACGFEKSGPAFDHHISQMASIEKSSLLDELRIPPDNKLVNRGKRLCKAEKEIIRQKYAVLIASGLTKKNAIDELSHDVGRGYWSILKTVDGTTNKSNGAVKKKIKANQLFHLFKEIKK
jgi:site-specific DNA-methyltransferase (adenine-specific)